MGEEWPAKSQIDSSSDARSCSIIASLMSLHAYRLCERIGRGLHGCGGGRGGGSGSDRGGCCRRRCCCRCWCCCRCRRSCCDRCGRCCGYCCCGPRHLRRTHRRVGCWRLCMLLLRRLRRLRNHLLRGEAHAHTSSQHAHTRSCSQHDAWSIHTNDVDRTARDW